MTLASILVLCFSFLGCRSSLQNRPRLFALNQPSALNPSAQQSFRQALRQDRAGQEACVDLYFAAVKHEWQALQQSFSFHDNFSGCYDAYNLYLQELLRAATCYKRLDPARGLRIIQQGNVLTIPVVHHGFPWQPEDFQCLELPLRKREPLLHRRYICDGIGVPLVAERRRNDILNIEAHFYPKKSYFAATALLRFTPCQPDSPSLPILEFYNPLQFGSLQCDDGSLPLASNITAPLASALQETPRTYLSGFIAPGQVDNTAKLTFLEPYQPGKIPVVIIHGLFSDPQSCADLINDLRASSTFTQRYQLWVFRYPTGQSFLQSAGALREQIQGAVEVLSTDQPDEALHHMVLVGHSMGGLVAKLQVTYSGDTIWNQLSNRPLEEINTSENTRAFLARTCFFDPSPHVKRVVWLAVPHQGSLQSSRLVGNMASQLIKPSPEQAAIHEQLMQDNPDTFNPLVQRRFPTSVDLLNPTAPFLKLMREMPIQPGVALHSVHGVVTPLTLDGPSDGIVSARSAFHPGCESDLTVFARHSMVHRVPQTSAEVLRILSQHEMLSEASPQP